MNAPRRVVSGLNAGGQSCIIIDGASPSVTWRNQTNPADNSGTDDAGGGAFQWPKDGAVFGFHDFAPHYRSPWHSTDSIDYIVVVSGEVTFICEAGETLLRPGDLVVDRGVMHAWRNDGATPCRIVNVVTPALPVGKGATMKEWPARS